MAISMKLDQGVKVVLDDGLKLKDAPMMVLGSRCILEGISQVYDTSLMLYLSMFFIS